MKMILIFVLSIICIISPSLNAEPSEVDKLKASLDNHQNNDIHKVELLNDLAYKFYDIDINKTLEYAKQAENLASELDDKKGLAESWRMIGIYYDLKSDFIKASQYYQKALTKFEEISDKLGIANSLNNIAYLYYLQEKFPESLEVYEKAIKSYQELGNKKRVSQCFTNMGGIYVAQGDYNEAIGRYQQGLDISKEIGNKSDVAKTLNNIGVVFLEQGLYKKALAYYYKSQQISINEKNIRATASSYHNIGNVFYLQSNYHKALENFQKSLALNKELNLIKQMGSILNNIGNIYYVQEEYLKALEHYENYLKTSEELNDFTGIANAQNNIGNVYFSKKNYSKAMKFFKVSLEIRKKLGQKKGIAESLRNIARIYHIQQEFDVAIEFTMKSLNINIEIGEKYGQAAAYNFLGKIYQALGDTNKAEGFVQKSLSLAKELELLGVQKQSYKLLSEIFTSKEQYKKALENHIRYKELSDSIFNEKNIKNISALEFQYKFDKQKQEIELAQHRKDIVRAEEEKQQIIIRNALIAGFILMSLLVLVVLRGFLLKRAANAEIEEKNEKLRVLNATKDKFFSIIAHDLRSPFNALLYLSDLLLEDFKKYDEDELGEIIKIINENTKSTFDLLENLLTWAHSQSGKITYSPENINIKELNKNLFVLFQPIAKNKSITLLDNTESNISVYADKNALNTILRNLIANALKFTKTNGSITISACESQKKGLIEISVTDTGIGIPEDSLDSLFRIDESVSTLGTENEKGTGLGLVLCKEFVEMNGGDIWIESKVGKGSKFIFTTIAVPE